MKSGNKGQVCPACGFKQGAAVDEHISATIDEPVFPQTHVIPWQDNV